MTHTLDSIMALADRMYSAPAGTLKDMIEIELRLAISEVLAERDSLKQSSKTYFAERNSARDAYMRHRTLAEKAEAECERLRELIAELDGHEGAEGWSEGMRERIDAALKEQP